MLLQPDLLPESTWRDPRSASAVLEPAHRGSESHYTLTAKDRLVKHKVIQVASEVVVTEAQLFLAPQISVLPWMIKWRIPLHIMQLMLYGSHFHEHAKVNITLFLWWRCLETYPVTSIATQNTLNFEKRVLWWQFATKRTELDNISQLWNYFVGIQTKKHILWLGISHSPSCTSHQEDRTRRCIIKNCTMSPEEFECCDAH